MLLWFWHNNRSAEEEEERHTRVDTGADEDCYGKAAGKGERGEGREGGRKVSAPDENQKSATHTGSRLTWLFAWHNAEGRMTSSMHQSQTLLFLMSYKSITTVGRRVGNSVVAGGRRGRQRY